MVVCFLCFFVKNLALQWRHKERDGLSNHRRANSPVPQLFFSLAVNTRIIVFAYKQSNQLPVV